MRKITSKMLSLLMFSSCVYEPKPQVIDVYNNSDSTVYGYYTCIDSIGNDRPLKLFFTTTSLSDSKEYITAPHYRFSPYSYCEGGLLSKSWGHYISNCSDKTLRVFFIAEEVMKNNNWSEIVKGQLYLKRIEITIDDLEKNDWLIEYNE